MKNIDPRFAEYFSTLPKYIQESIMQTGLDFKNEEEMRNFVAELKTTEG